MPNLVVTSTTNSIKVVFNNQPFYDKREGHTYKKATWAKRDIANMKLETNESFVVVQERDGFVWLVSQDGYTGTFTIDSVDGAAPTNNSDLYDKLVALLT